ncbi:hypothetical protein IRJ41_006981 [Triplophysa rosa]|uniref:Uncharacterized protein n=1 Tax=Triplophysa rosa TaxID=992332 RepID=A0A9W7WE34_TRIRA|nr:hypothetical protein IRJ41_006981 [Triplophysa rosa]
MLRASHCGILRPFNSTYHPQRDSLRASVKSTSLVQVTVRRSQPCKHEKRNPVGESTERVCGDGKNTPERFLQGFVNGSQAVLLMSCGNDADIGSTHVSGGRRCKLAEKQKQHKGLVIKSVSQWRFKRTSVPPQDPPPIRELYKFSSRLPRISPLCSARSERHFSDSSQQVRSYRGLIHSGFDSSSAKAFYCVSLEVNTTRH